MMYIYRWRTTHYGPLCEELQGRFGATCKLLVRGAHGSLGIEFEDSYRVVVPYYAVRKVTT